MYNTNDSFSSVHRSGRSIARDVASLNAALVYFAPFF